MTSPGGSARVPQLSLTKPPLSPAPLPWEEGAVRDVVELLSKRWVLSVLGALWERPLRRSHLQDALEGVSDKSLTRALRDLMAAGYVSRRFYDDTPPRVVYRLTSSGRSMGRLLAVINKWSGQQPGAGQANI